MKEYKEKAISIVDRLFEGKKITIRERGTLRRAIFENERQKGEWIPVKHKNSFGMLVDCFQCSNCNLYTLPRIKVMIDKKLRICPNCGAQMIEEGGENET